MVLQNSVLKRFLAGILYLNRVSESEKSEDFKNLSWVVKKEYEKIYFKIFKDEVMVHDFFFFLGKLSPFIYWCQIVAIDQQSSKIKYGYSTCWQNI